MYTFGKTERLSYKRQIDTLINDGLSFNISPFKLIYYLNQENPSPGVKVLIAVPKKRFKKAVTRNHIRRLIREAYRLNKHRMLESLFISTIELHIGFIYIGNKNNISYQEIEKPVISCLEKLTRVLENSSGSSGLA